MRKVKTRIGIEIHAQIASASKIFSGASTGFAAPPNSHVALLDAGMPGSLPILNRHCVDQGIKTALALGCTVNPRSHFER